MARRKHSGCVGSHRVLIVDQWTPLGCFVTCICGDSFHADHTLLEEMYLCFVHTSSEGPLEDKGCFMLETLMEGR